MKLDSVGRMEKVKYMHSPGSCKKSSWCCVVVLVAYISGAFAGERVSSVDNNTLCAKECKKITCRGRHMQLHVAERI